MELQKIIKGLESTKSFLKRRINGIETAIIGLKAADEAVEGRRKKPKIKVVQKK
jgi:hypothetical protein